MVRFSKLTTLWKHDRVAKQRKVEAFQSMVVSRLLYGLSGAWLNVAETRRLNGFQARCLRAALGIAPSYISRTSNAAVLRGTSQKPSSTQLLQQQLLLYGKVARAHNGDVMRALTFQANTLEPAVERYVRRVGRPRNEWTTMLRKESFKISPQSDELLHDALGWTEAVRRYCKK